MKYSGIKAVDTANGYGVRVSLFVSGCRLNCFNCFNKESQSFIYGEDFTQETINKILNLCDKKWISGLSLLGGDPMEKENQPEVLNLCKQFKEKFPNKDIWLWTGRIFPKDFQEGGNVYLKDITEELIKHIDVLIDGPFIQEQHSKTLKFRGSKNQRMIVLNHKK